MKRPAQWQLIKLYQESTILEQRRHLDLLYVAFHKFVVLHLQLRSIVFLPFPIVKVWNLSRLRRHLTHRGYNILFWTLSTKYLYWSNLSWLYLQWIDYSSCSWWYQSIMQVGMAEWSKSLPPDREVVGSILGHDNLWKAIGGASGPL